MTPWDGPVNWAGMSHPQLYLAATVDNEPGVAYELGRDWAALGADMLDQAQVLAARIAATEPGWRGAAGETVRAATLALTRWCRDAGTSAQAVGECVTEQADAAEAARVLMPEPDEFDWDTALGSFGRAGDPLAAVSDLREPGERARTALERAVDVMTELERWSERIDGEIPTCPEPPPPPQARTGGAEAATGAGALPAVPAPGGDGRTTTAGVTGGVAGAAEPTLAGFGGTGGAEVRGASPAPVLSPRIPLRSVPVERGQVDLPAPGGPATGRGPLATGGPGMLGAPGAGTGTGAGQSGEHRTPRFLGGEKVFNPLPAVPAVIGDTWTAEWSAGPTPATDREGRSR
ncbi:PPE domain-containing protein [Actinophytocola xanthii]|uniref:Uncharacterized protein n=1 Tax=Actinophytocola xanthii TaxID=1912961 RepID=A0A1Q8CXR6_9PSEU|nr:PPE domain-containing protein [Actinophytocola xanthii]OLF19151.1 hypothetical protein BU204_01915 [Actinophytocola xanthii]